MRQATQKEIDQFHKYRDSHIALVQRIGSIVFGEDFSKHDSDKCEASGDLLNMFALRNAVINGEYNPKGEDKEKINSLPGQHVKSQKHHPEFWDLEISADNWDESNPPKVNAQHMPDRWIKEMCADWAAVALKKNQPIFKWYNKTCCGDNPRFIFTDKQKELIINSLSLIQKAIKKEHLSYPGITYNSKQVEPLKESKINLKAYHGTDNQFDNFDISKLKDDLGIFFTPDKSSAEHYGKIVKEVNLNLSNPLIVYQGKDYSEKLGKNPGETEEDLRKRLLDQGYDSVIINYDNPSGGYTQDIVVLNPNVIEQSKITEDVEIRSGAGDKDQILTFADRVEDYKFSLQDGKRNEAPTDIGIHSFFENEENFNKWFGNSKIVDKEGNPEIMYHETNWNMEETGDYIFDLNKTECDCFFFKNYPSKEGLEYGDFTYKVYLKVENPRIIERDNYPFKHEFMKQGEEDGVIWIDTTPGSTKKVVSVFSPNQIKSATDNNGDFSMESSKITEYCTQDLINDVDKIEKQAINFLNHTSSPYYKGASEGKIVACEEVKDLAQKLPSYKPVVGPEDLFVESNGTPVFVVADIQGRIIPNTKNEDIDKVKEIRNFLARQYNDIFKVLKLSTATESLKTSPYEYKLTEDGEGGGGSGMSSGAVGGGATNTSSGFASMAPEKPAKVVKLGKGSGLIDPSGQLLEFKEEAGNLLKESIIDIPQKEYCKEVLNGEKMNSKLRTQILQTIKTWKDQINFDFDVYKVLAKGSLLTKRYNDTTDLDVSIYTNMTKEQLDEIFDIIPKGQNIEGTNHPLDFYVLTKGEETPDKNLDNIYDVAHDKFIKRSEEYDNPIPLDYVIQVGNFLVNGAVISLSNYENDKIMFNYYKDANSTEQEISEEEKQQALSNKKKDLQADLDGMKLALHMISAFRGEAYDEEPNPFKLSIEVGESDNPHVSLNEELVKVLEKFGIRDKLRDSVKECEELLGIEENAELQESVEDKTAAFCFGRYNPPSVGHLLLFTILSKVTADDHLIYASHSQDKKKNPLDYSTKSALIKAILKENKVNAEFVDSEARTLIEVAVDLYNKGYKNIIFVGGSDRVEDVTNLLKKYNDVPDKEGRSYHFDYIGSQCAGDRDPDAEDITGVSGTKLRQFCVDGDFENFCKYTPLSDKHILKEVFDQIRSVMVK